jgi:hypothetical protein
MADHPLAQPHPPTHLAEFPFVPISGLAAPHPGRMHPLPRSRRAPGGRSEVPRRRHYTGRAAHHASLKRTHREFLVGCLGAARCSSICSPSPGRFLIDSGFQLEISWPRAPETGTRRRDCQQRRCLLPSRDHGMPRPSLLVAPEACEGERARPASRPRKTPRRPSRSSRVGNGAVVALGLAPRRSAPVRASGIFP